MAIQDTIPVTITIRDTTIAQANFGTPLVLAYHTNFVGEVREYNADASGLSAMVTDGFAVTSDPYRKVAAIASQSPHCSSVKVAARVAPTQQVLQYTPKWTTVGRIVRLSFELTGVTTTVSYTPIAADDAEDIVDGLITALGTVAGVTISKSGSGSAAVLVLTLTTPGEERIYPISAVGLGLEDVSVDPGAPVVVTTTEASPAVQRYPIDLSDTPLGGGRDVVLESMTVTITTCGTAGSTVLELTYGDVPVAIADTEVTVPHDATDPYTVTLTAADFGLVTLTGGDDSLAINVTSAATDVAGLSVAVTVHDVEAGVDAELAAAQLIDPDFYGVLIDTEKASEIVSAATWCEANEKLFAALSGDENNTVADSGVAHTISAAGRNRTSVWVTRNIQGQLAAAIMGRQFSQDAGSSTWAHKQLSGPVADAWTATEFSALRGDGEGDRGNGACTYVADQGLSHTYDGFAASGRFLDITRGIDWLKSTIRQALLVALVSVEKIRYSDAGTAVLEAALAGRLSAAEGRALLEPGWAVIRPAVSTQAAADRAARVYRNLAFTGTLSGAIHKVPITGDVSV